MKRERRIGQRVDQAIVQHEPRTMMAFFARLEHEHYRTRELVTPRAQRFGRPRQHRDMGVMPAGMHRALVLGGERQSGLFDERQRIHIATQQNRAAVRRPP